MSTQPSQSKALHSKANRYTAIYPDELYLAPPVCQVRRPANNRPVIQRMQAANTFQINESPHTLNQLHVPSMMAAHRNILIRHKESWSRKLTNRERIVRLETRVDALSDSINEMRTNFRFWSNMAIISGLALFGTLLAVLAM